MGESRKPLIFPLPNAYDLFVTSAAFNGAQFLTTLLFRRRLRLEFGRRVAPYAPSVTVIVACKGEAPDFGANMEALLDQDYAGHREYLFATPSRADPAYRRLQTLLARRGATRARLCASEALPSRCSGKALDLLFALKQAPAQTELLLFADADIRVHRAWLSDMAAPLQDERVGAATSALLAVPRRLALWSFLRFIWIGLGVSCWVFMKSVCGQSLAMRRKDFYDLGVPALWEGALLEDLTLTARLRRWEKEVRFVARAMPVPPADCDAAQFFDVCNRWTKCYRIFDASVWLLAVAYLAMKAGITLWALGHHQGRLLAFFWGFDMLNMFFLVSTYLRYLPDRFERLRPALRRFLPLLAALASPLLTAIYLLNFLTSVLNDEVFWGSYVYRVGEDKTLKVARR